MKENKKQMKRRPNKKQTNINEHDRKYKKQMRKQGKRRTENVRSQTQRREADLLKPTPV